MDESTIGWTNNNVHYCNFINISAQNDHSITKTNALTNKKSGNINHAYMFGSLYNPSYLKNYIVDVLEK